MRNRNPVDKPMAVITDVDDTILHARSYWGYLINMIRGLEATSVMVPPRMAQNPIGMTSRDMGIRVRKEMRDTTGRNNAAAPTFCMNEDMTATVPALSVTIFFSVLPP